MGGWGRLRVRGGGGGAEAFISWQDIQCTDQADEDQQRSDKGEK